MSFRGCDRIRLICRRFTANCGVVVLPALLVSLVFGCGTDDGLNRQPISGTVTVDGAPVPNGSISFEPLMAGGVGSGATISGGNYTIGAEFGLPPGKYRVSITGDDGVAFPVSPGKMPGDEEMPAKRKLIPDRWNEENHEIEVKDNGQSTFDFAISTKPK